MGNKKKKPKAKKTPIQKRNPNLALNTRSSLFAAYETKEEVMAAALQLSEGKHPDAKIVIGAQALDAIARIIGKGVADALTKGLADINAKHEAQRLTQHTGENFPVAMGVSTARENLQAKQAELDARLPK